MSLCKYKLKTKTNKTNTICSLDRNTKHFEILHLIRQNAFKLLYNRDIYIFHSEVDIELHYSC